LELASPRSASRSGTWKQTSDAALFRRVAHGAELTEAGKVFLPVKEMPLIDERATMAARRTARGETGSLRVGFTSTATFNVVVPSAIRTFRRAYQEIHLTLEEANTTQVIPACATQHSTSCSFGQARPVLESYS
jgi:DNA-binding transcriptional LysR family regulator